MSRIVAFLLLFSFWLLLSGHFDLLHLGLGLLCSAVVAWFGGNLLVGTSTGRSISYTLLPRYLSYLSWLLGKIVWANLDVAYRTLHPRLPIDPVVVTFDTSLSSERAKVILANSITLTPGTVTIDLDQRRLTVHALTRDAGENLVDMERRVRPLESVAGP